MRLAINLLLAAICSLIIVFGAQAQRFHGWGDAPIYRSTMYIPKWLDVDKRFPSRWIWLRHKTNNDIEVTLGRGQYHLHNRISSFVRSTDGRDAWQEAFFVRTTRGRFFERIGDSIYFAIVPLDIGSNYVRDAMIYRLDDEYFSDVGRILKFNCTDDKPVFRSEAKFNRWVNSSWGKRNPRYKYAR